MTADTPLSDETRADHGKIAANPIPGNADVEAIRERHSYLEVGGLPAWAKLSWSAYAGQTHADRATLLRLVDAQSTALQEARKALASAVAIAGEAAEEWDKAPNGMRAGKILLALAGHRPGYRADTDAMHAALAALPATEEK